MYIPQAFEEKRIEVLHELMRAHPFATLVTGTQDGLEANHIPLLVEPGSAPFGEPAPFGSLAGHVAKANPVWREGADAHPVLAIFQGPHTYISPSWYPSKREHGKVVPTWNYAVVHVRGTLSIVSEPKALRTHLEALTARHEARQTEPWQLSDAPDEFIDQMLGGVRGIRIEITSLEGKWKMSQNRNAADRRGVIEALETQGSEPALAVAGQTKP